MTYNRNSNRSSFLPKLNFSSLAKKNEEIATNKTNNNSIFNLINEKYKIDNQNVNSKNLEKNDQTIKLTNREKKLKKDITDQINEQNKKIEESFLNKNNKLNLSKMDHNQSFSNSKKSERKSNEKNSHNNSIIKIMKSRRNSKEFGFSRSNTLVINHKAKDKKYNHSLILGSKDDIESNKILINHENPKYFNSDINSQNNSIVIEEESENDEEENITNRKNNISSIEVKKPRFYSLNNINEIEKLIDSENLFVKNIQPNISLDEFLVLGELGRGKFGTVVKVKRKSTGDIFALKIIQMNESINQKSEQENLKSEIEILKQISNEFVVQAFYW